MQESQAKEKRDEVMFKAFAPRSIEPILECFELSTTVGAAAEKISEQFKYESGTYTLQDEEGKVLDREKTLREAGVKCGSHLELVSTGGGVFIVPRPATLDYLQNELAAVRALCERKKISYFWSDESLELRLVLNQPLTGELFYLSADCTDEPALPPAWIFSDSEWENRGAPRNIPQNTNTPFGSSIFHKVAGLCVPFNRLAYQENNGPHQDWGGCANWKSVNGNMVKASTLADMISVVLRDLSYSKGRME